MATKSFRAANDFCKHWIICLTCLCLGGHFACEIIAFLTAKWLHFHVKTSVSKHLHTCASAYADVELLLLAWKPSTREPTRPCNSDKRVIWIFLISISLCLLSYVSLPTTDTSAEERGCVCVCACVGLLGRSLAAIQLSVCWLYSVRRFVGLINFRHWVGSTFNNWQFRNIVNYFNLKSI